MQQPPMMTTPLRQVRDVANWLLAHDPECRLTTAVSFGLMVDRAPLPLARLMSGAKESDNPIGFSMAAVIPERAADLAWLSEEMRHRDHSTIVDALISTLDPNRATIKDLEELVSKLRRRLEDTSAGN